MNADTRIDREALAQEIARYLATVDLFRAVGCEPVWRPEPGGAIRPKSASGVTDTARVAH